MGSLSKRRAQSSRSAAEDHSKGAMLRFEDSLPRLPVPSLQETAKRYLKSVHPLLSAAEYEATTKAVDDFVAPGGRGETLQRRLVARSERPDVANWLAEWWNTAAYMGYRAPVVPYVSYFYSHRDDRRRRDPAKRAAALTTAALEFKRLVDTRALEPEYMKNMPMAMSSYEWMFNCCRLPRRPVDTSTKADPKDHAHIVVVRKNQFWKIPHNVGGKQLNASELELQFRRIYQHAEESARLGLLTTQNRHVWADVYSRLAAVSETNRASLAAIETASFVVCLDDAAPVTLEERAHQYWHGDGANRWFDKPCQFIVNDNGTSGFMGEHSMMDGTPTHRLNDHVNRLIFTDALDLSDPTVRSHLPDPTPLRFSLTPELERDVEAAQQHFTQQIGAHELRVQAYQGYGKGLIKRFKCSPDAYVQMVIQLAYHKFYDKSRPTYESAATRRFQLGRTETCRTVSDESVAFCASMASPTSSPDECRARFRAALDAHIRYLSDATAGLGVDRHLFGLRQCISPGEPTPALFEDPAYAYSSTWFVSSSQLSSEFFNGYGWSQVVDDGWGIAYMINENSLHFNIVCKCLGADKMSFYLAEAASEMRDLMLPVLEPPKAKL